MLTEESKLTTMQRNKVNYFLRNGEEMRTPKSEHNFEKSRFPKVTIRPGSSRRRSIDSILQSGAYEREKFVPLHPAVNREQAIKHLQNVLAYDKNARASPKTSRRQKKKNKEEKQTEDINRFDERTYSYDHFKHYLQQRFCYIVKALMLLITKNTVTKSTSVSKTIRRNSFLF